MIISQFCKSWAWILLIVSPTVEAAFLAVQMTLTSGAGERVALT
jgi:hypothetical protein